MPNKKFCPHCLKVDVPNVNMIKIELSIKHLSKEFKNQNTWINILIKKSSWSKIGNTDTVTKSENPVFKEFILAEFTFESEQRIQFQLFSEDTAKEKGQASCTIGEIVGSNKSGNSIDILNSKGQFLGKLSIQCSKANESSESIFLQFQAQGLKNVEESEYDKSDPFLIISKYNNNKLVKVYKSETVLNNLNPSFRRFIIRTNHLCDNIPTNPIAVQCFDWEEEDVCEYIGETEFTL